LSIKQAAEGGEVSEEYREAFGEHAYDDEGNYIGFDYAEGEFTPETEAQAAWAEFAVEVTGGKAEGAEGVEGEAAPAAEAGADVAEIATAAPEAVVEPEVATNPQPEVEPEAVVEVEASADSGDPAPA
jgi:small subunit ribosomal protein S1